MTNAISDLLSLHTPHATPLHNPGSFFASTPSPHKALTAYRQLVSQVLFHPPGAFFTVPHVPCTIVIADEAYQVVLADSHEISRVLQSLGTTSTPHATGPPTRLSRLRSAIQTVQLPTTCNVTPVRIHNTKHATAAASHASGLASAFARHYHGKTSSPTGTDATSRRTAQNKTNQDSAA